MSNVTPITNRSASPAPTTLISERVYAVVVTYYPDLKQLDKLLTAVQSQVTRVAIVDNTPSSQVANWLSTNTTYRDIRLFSEGRNTGVGAGHNRGIEWALHENASHVLLLDQDSVPAPDMVRELIDAWRSLVGRKVRISGVGPQFIDRRSLAPSYFVRYGWFGKERKSCRKADADQLVGCDFLISSGALIPLDVIRDVGLMDESLFIDHVDTEWFLRARAKGYKAFGVCRAVMEHSLGDDRRRFWLGRRYAIVRYQPVRYYYIFRNSVLLYRRDYVSKLWKVSDMGRLLGLVLLHAIFYAPRSKNLAMIFKGLWDGWHGRTGVYR